MKKVILLILFSILYFQFSAAPVFASTVFFEQRGSVVDVFLDTEGQRINAFEGTLTSESETVQLQKIEDGASVVNFWITEPESSVSQVFFSGITPGGFLGSRGFLFSTAFNIKRESSVVISLRDGKFLKNDGLGSEDQLTVIPFTANMSFHPWYQNVLIWIIIIVVGVSVAGLVFFVFKLWQRKHF